MDSPKIFDNVTSRVIDDLRVSLKKGSKVSIAAASFSIYAYEALKNELESIDELQFIFTSPTFTKEKSKKEKREARKAARKTAKEAAEAQENTDEGEK